MDGPIDIKQLFNFDDTTSFEKMLVLITELNTFYDTLVQSAKKGSADITASMQLIQKSIESLEGEMQTADSTTKKGQETIAKGAETTGKAVAQNEEYKKSLASLTDTIKMLQEQIDKLEDAKEKSKKGTEAEVGSLATLKAQLKDATDAYNKMGIATDGAVKADALKRVAELNTQVKAGTQVVNDTKKAVDVAAGSYNDLAAKVAIATKQLKAFEGGVGSQSVEFQKLQKFVTDGNVTLKEFDSILGNNQRRVGGYKEEIAALVPTLRRLSEGTAVTAENVVLLGEKASLFGSALAIGLGSIAAIVATVTTLFEVGKFAVEEYFSRSIEGADRANRINAIFSAGIETIKDKFAALGEVLVDAFESKKFQVGFLSSLIAMFPILSAITLALVKQTGLLDDFNAKLKLTKELAEIENALKKEQLKIGIEIAEQEKRKADDLFDSRDKLRKSDQDRFNAALDQRKAIEAIIALKLKENDLEIKAANDELLISGDNYKNEQKISDLKAKRINIEAELTQGQRRSLQLLDSIAVESIKRAETSEKAIEDANKITDEAIVKSKIDSATRIIGNQDYSAEQQLEAQKDLTNQQLQLVSIGAEKQTEAARIGAIARIRLSTEELQEIFDQSKGDLNKLVELTINANNAKFASDVAYKTEVGAIATAAATEEQKILKDDVNKKAKILIDNSAYFINLKKRFIDEDRTQDLKALDDSFLAGEVSLRQYAIKKAEILRGGNQLEMGANKQAYIDELNALQDFLKKNVDLHGTNKDQILALIKSLQTEILHITESGSLLIENAQKALNAKLIQLEQEIANAVLTIGDNKFKAQQDQINAHIQQLNDQKTLELNLAGNNAEGKLKIERDFQAKNLILQKELRKSQHNQAIFERDVALAQVQIEAGKAIAATLIYFATPATVALGAALDIAIGAIAVAQTIAILSKPIPGYSAGTKNHLGGPAIVHEHELVTEPGKDPVLYDTPGATLTYLKPGTEVLTAKETERAFQMNSFKGSLDNGPRKEIIVVTAPKTDFAPVINAIEHNKPRGVLRQALEVYEVAEDRKGNKRYIHSKIFGGR